MPPNKSIPVAGAENSAVQFWPTSRFVHLIGSIRRKCPDHLVVFDEAHLRRTLAAYALYYDGLRTHLSLDKDSPSHRPIRRLGSPHGPFIVDFIMNTVGCSIQQGQGSL